MVAVKAQNSQSNRYRAELWRSGMTNRARDAAPISEIHASRFQLLISAIFTSHDQTSETTNEAELPQQFRRGSNTSLGYTRSRTSNSSQRVKEVQQQAILFIFAFIFTRGLSYVNRALELFHGSSPFWLHCFAKTFLAFQGVFNIFVYTRPHVTTFRRRNHGSSWIQAFVAVVKRGGDSDRITSRRRSSIAPRNSLTSRAPLRQSQIRQHQIEAQTEPIQTAPERRELMNPSNIDDESESITDLEEIMKTVAVLKANGEGSTFDSSSEENLVIVASGEQPDECEDDN